MIFDNRFQGRHAVVTGGAAGLGAGIAARIKAEGGTVEVWDINADALAAIDDHATRQIDVTDAETVQAAMVEANPDILVCSAGITGPNTTTWDYPVADWLAVHNLNLNAGFYCCRAAAPSMQAKGWGRIVNIAATSGRVGNAGQANYAAAKSGLVGMTRSVARELGGKGVTANVVAPGFINTDMTGDLPEDVMASIQSMVQVGRLGEPEDIAAAVAFATADAAGFMTGQVITVDGGMTMC